MSHVLLLAAGSGGQISAPSVSYAALSPILIVLGAGILGVAAEAVVPRRDRFAAQVTLTLGALIAAAVAVGIIHDTNTATPSPEGSNVPFAGSLAVDSTGLFLQGTILALAIMAVLLMAERTVDVGSPIVASAAVVVGSPDDRRLARSSRVQTEIFPLALFAVAGMLIFPIANNLLLMFVALEVLSLPLYLMAGMARRRRLLSQEAAVKYFLLGAFASAFFLYGLALLYGYADSVDLPTILQATRTSGKSDILLYAGLALLLVGLLFKAGIAPFHSWTPDVYCGSPTPVTAFMAACTKVAAFGAIIRVLYVGFSTTSYDWRPIIWAAAIASMVVGALFGLTQTDVKRILAYSSIAHAGFILVGLLAVNSNGTMAASGISSVMFYLLTYGFTTLAAFGSADGRPGLRGGGDPAVAVVGPGEEEPRRRDHDDRPAAVDGRHPADVRVHRQVRGLPRRLQQRRPARGDRPDRLGDRGVLLPPHRRADVLRRPARERAHHRDSRLVDLHRVDVRRRRDHRAGCVPATDPGPRRPGRPADGVTVRSRSRG